MSPRSRKYDPAYAPELLAIAKGDLASAKLLASATGGRRENIVFLVQQSVEKCLKAVLAHKGIAFPAVHDLGALIALVPEEVSPPHGYDLVELNQYATIRRYELASAPLTEDEIQSSLSAGESVAAWADKLIAPI